MNEHPTVLITGAEGFIGSHLTEYLLSQNFKVKALSLYNSFNDWGWLEGISHPDLEIITGDIRDPFFCLELTKDVDVVFHLAALIAIPFSYKSPSSYIETNIKGTLNICEASLKNSCKRLIHTSTSEVYGTAQYVPIDENHPLQPQSPYSASKIGADAIAKSYYYSFSLPLTIARPFNTFGPRQSARAIIPTIITQLLTGKNKLHIGDLKPTRDFTYVKDLCRAFYLIAKSPSTIGETINIGSNFEISVKELLGTLQKLLKVEVEIISDSHRIRPKNSEVFRLWCNNNKLKQLTGYTPLYTFEQALNETIEWFRNTENLRKYKPNIYNV